MTKKLSILFYQRFLQLFVSGGQKKGKCVNCKQSIQVFNHLCGSLDQSIRALSQKALLYVMGRGYVQWNLHIEQPNLIFRQISGHNFMYSTLTNYIYTCCPQHLHILQTVRLMIPRKPAWELVGLPFFYLCCGISVNC